jgi:hypothetical protein
MLPRHHYWTGLIILAHCITEYLFVFGYELLVNAFMTTFLLTAIFVLKSCILKVYKVVLSVSLLYLWDIGSSDHASCLCPSISMSISMVTFAGVLIYLQLHKAKWFRS